MAEVNPPLHMQARTDHTAAGDRALIETLMPVAGVADPAHLLVTQNGTPNMSVNVAAGRVVVDGTENALQGVYHCVNDATKNVTIAAADATNPRIDLIVARVRDASYSGVTNAWAIEAVTGTPAATPVAPATPANSYVLAQISVPANATAITNSQITDRRSSLIVGGNPPGCIVHRQTAQGISHATMTAIQFNSPDIRDTHGFHDPSSNNTRMTVPAGLGGLYLAGANVGFSGNGTGSRITRLLKNGTTVIGSLDGPAPSADVTSFQCVTVPVLLVPGDYLEVVVYQTSGGILNTYASSITPQFGWMQRIGTA